MSLVKIYQLSSASLLAIGLTLGSFANAVEAQTEVEPNITVVEEDDSFEWGWLGLFGLLGLAGLAGKNNRDRHEVINTEPFPEAPKRTR